jgi:very-short-patch-repair endonuclease
MSTEREISSLERAQFGLVTTKQLQELGLTQSAIVNRVGGDRHRRVRKGVLLSPSVAASFETRVLAAVMAGGDLAFGSHESAARIHQQPLPCAAAIEVTTDLERRPRLRGVKVHRSGLILPEDVCIIDGIRVSTPARTIVDLSGRYDSRVIGRMIDDALRRHLTSMAELYEATQRLKSAPGRSQKTMRTLLLRRDGSSEEHESILEDFVFDSLRRFKLPIPIAQYKVTIEGRDRRIDFCYAEERVALEPKGFGPHSSRQAFDEDALRGNELRLAGFQVLEFTSAFSDWRIASHVARSLDRTVPTKPKRERTFFEWLDRLDGFRRYSARKRPNTR